MNDMNPNNTQDKKTESALIGKLVFTPTMRYLIVEEDKFRSGYECKGCDGTGVVVCPRCENDALKKKSCKWCKDGYATCADCNGKGSSIVVPDTAKRRPTTGIVRAIGPEVRQSWLLGKRVLYSNYAGAQMILPQKNGQKLAICILDENEIKCCIDGVVVQEDLVLDFTPGQ